MKTASLFLFAFWLCFQPPTNGLAASNHQPFSFTVRTVSENELVRLGMADRAPDLNACLDILSRLNTGEPFYILRDMRQGKKLKVPDDFNAFKTWTPLPARIPQKSSEPKFIMVVKELGFIGWYEHGALVGDSQACFGSRGQNTVPGLYRVDDKDSRHTSSSYRNDYGEQAWMPFSLHIYEAVWIHAGNVFGPHCSHGCITMPFEKAEKLYGWAEKGTPVLVADDLKDVCGEKTRSERFDDFSPSKSSNP